MVNIELFEKVYCFFQKKANKNMKNMKTYHFIIKIDELKLLQPQHSKKKN